MNRQVRIFTLFRGVAILAILVILGGLLTAAITTFSPKTVAVGEASVACGSPSRSGM